MPRGEVTATADVFVGSSSQFLELPWNPKDIITKALEGQLLENGTKLHVNAWDDWSKRHAGYEIFAMLDLAAKTHEWAVVIFRADDLTRRVGDVMEKGAVRDNVLFETGLFYGHLGSKRVFILEEKADGQELKILFDLYGMLRLRFDSAESFAEQMKLVLQTIKERSTQWYPSWTPAASLVIGYVNQFVEPFVTMSVDKRQAAGADKDFVLKVLLPTEDFRGMTVPEVRRMFEGSDCVQIGPDGSADQRPLAWTKVPAAKRKPKAAEAPGKHFPATYFDVPTTLFTAEKVITNYLGQQATLNEQRELFKNQANAFANYIEQQPEALTEHVEVVRVPSMGKAKDHLGK